MGAGQCPGADCSIRLQSLKRMSCDGSLCVSGGFGNCVILRDATFSQLV